MKKLALKYLKPLAIKSWIKPILIVGLVYISRFGFLPPNLSPVGSLGFFSKSILPLLLVTLGFDLLFGGHYTGFLWTYAGFAMYFVVGLVARKTNWFGKDKGLVKRQIVLLPLASFLFFLLSNFGVWLSWYPRTMEGLFTCYTMALPFYKNTLMGDLVFGGGVMLIQVVLNQKYSLFTRLSKV